MESQTSTTSEFHSGSTGRDGILETEWRAQALKKGRDLLKKYRSKKALSGDTKPTTIAKPSIITEQADLLLHEIHTQYKQDLARYKKEISEIEKDISRGIRDPHNEELLKGRKIAAALLSYLDNDRIPEEEKIAISKEISLITSMDLLNSEQQVIDFTQELQERIQKAYSPKEYQTSLNGQDLILEEIHDKYKHELLRYKEHIKDFERETKDQLYLPAIRARQMTSMLAANLFSYLDAETLSEQDKRSISKEITLLNSLGLLEKKEQIMDFTAEITRHIEKTRSAGSQAPPYASQEENLIKDIQARFVHDYTKYKQQSQTKAASLKESGTTSLSQIFPKIPQLDLDLLSYLDDERLSEEDKMTISMEIALLSGSYQLKTKGQSIALKEKISVIVEEIVRSK